MNKHLLTLHDWTTEEILDTLELAKQLKDEQKKGIEHHHLKGKTLGMIFTKSSTRTRVSFEVGMYQLGGSALFLSANDIQLGRGESIYDTANVLSRFVDGIMIRTFKQSDVEDLAKYGQIPIINGLTDLVHPCQILADFQTVIEKKGNMFNARHILLKPEYTTEDMEKGFRVLDSLKTELANEAVTFELAARFYSEDPATRTNGGQMADPSSGSSYFEIDQLKPQDYAAIKDLKEGEISEPFSSLDNEGRNGNTVYKIIRVDKIIPAHPASFSKDYTLLLGYAKNNLQMKAINDFIDSKIKSTYIIIDPLFKDCSFERDGWEEKFRK